MKRQFTATIYILREQKILLIFHKKMGKWLPAGGHLEENELPIECAKREAEEETGYQVDIIRQENVWIDEEVNAKSFERPYQCLLELIPPHKGEPEHQHVDFVYIGYPIGGAMCQNADETEGLRWFSCEDLEKLDNTVLFNDTRTTLKCIFNDEQAWESIPTLVSCV